MKKLFTCFICSICSLACAAEFQLKPQSIGELINALSDLDGYRHSVDQGPGNPAKIVEREPYVFSSDTRSRLGANHHALVKAMREFNEKLAAIRLSISGNPDEIDAKNPAQVKAWNEQARPLFDTPILIELSPITAAELTDNKNPIPISTLSILNLLRPPVAK